MIYKRNLFEKLYISIAVLLTFLKKEKNLGGFSLNIKKIKLFFKGFNSKRPIPYNFIKWNYKDYISDLETIKLTYLNYPYSKLLRDKYVFSVFFKDFFKTPEIFCLIDNKRILPVNSNNYINNFKSLLFLLEKEKSLILKPNFSSRGKNINLVQYSDGKILVNNRVISSDQFQELLLSLNNYLASEFIIQGSCTKNLFPSTTNTLRINSFYDPLKSHSFIKQAYLRIGTSKTIPVDNFSRGGIISFVDMDTGILNETIRRSEDGRVLKCSHHPESNELIAGKILPHWEIIKKNILNTTELIGPIIKIVGWDIIITEDDFVVLEGNNGPDFTQQGEEWPLARDKEVFSFLESVKVR